MQIFCIFGKTFVSRASGFGYLLWYRCKVCNSIPVPKQVLIPDTLIWHLVWYCWYDTRSKAMLWYLIFLFWYLFDISALAPVRFFFCWFLFFKTKKKWTKQRYLLFCSKKVYDFTLLWVKRPVCLFLFLKNKNISICRKKASTIHRKKKNFFNCLSAFIVCSVSFITKRKFFSFCFTWTTIKKAKAWKGKKKATFETLGMDKEKKLFLSRQQIKKIVVQQSQNCLGLLCFFLTVIALGQNKTKKGVFVHNRTKERSCFKKFLTVLFSLSEVKPS